MVPFIGGFKIEGSLQMEESESCQMARTVVCTVGWVLQNVSISVYAVPYTLLPLGGAHIQLRDYQSFSRVRLTQVNTFKFISDLISRIL